MTLPEAQQPEALLSPLLARARFRHAFFTRRGGVSSAPFDSLNFSAGVGDAPESVEENFRRAAALLGVARDRIFLVSQVHGHEVAEVRPEDDFAAFARQRADAVLSTRAGVACAIRTADCVPLLIADTGRRAVAAVHAGWRGVQARIAQHAVRRMLRAGAEAASLIVAIGPHISVRAFEVGEEVAEGLRASSSTDGVVERPVRGGRPRVNLLSILLSQLEEVGVARSRVDVVEGCSHGEPERFFSYRRDGAHSGRMMSAIVAGDPTPSSGAAGPAARLGDGREGA